MGYLGAAENSLGLCIRRPETWERGFILMRLAVVKDLGVSALARLTQHEVDGAALGRLGTEPEIGDWLMSVWIHELRQGQTI